MSYQPCVTMRSRQTTVQTAVTTKMVPANVTGDCRERIRPAMKNRAAANGGSRTYHPSSVPRLQAWKRARVQACVAEGLGQGDGVEPLAKPAGL